MNEDDSRRRVIGAALKLCREHGYDKLTLDAVAVASDVPVGQITQWWPSVSALVIDAFRAEIGPKLSYPSTGDFASDLRTQLVATARLFAADDFGPHLAALVAAAQRDAGIAATFTERVYGPNRAVALARFREARDAGQLRRDLDLDIAVDVTFAPLWFRLLLGAGKVTAAYAEETARLALSGLRPEAALQDDSRRRVRLLPTRQSEWAGGFVANVAIGNTGKSTINGWTLTFAFPGDQKVTSAWNAAVAQSGQSVTATSLAYKAAIAPGGSTSFGMQGTWTANDASPASFTLNGAACS